MCEVCGKRIEYYNNKRYCDECAKQIKMEMDKKRMRKLRLIES